MAQRHPQEPAQARWHPGRAAARRAACCGDRHRHQPAPAGGHAAGSACRFRRARPAGDGREHAVRGPADRTAGERWNSSPPPASPHCATTGWRATPSRMPLSCSPPTLPRHAKESAAASIPTARCCSKPPRASNACFPAKSRCVRPEPATRCCSASTPATRASSSACATAPPGAPRARSITPTSPPCRSGYRHQQRASSPATSPAIRRAGTSMHSPRNCVSRSNG